MNKKNIFKYKILNFISEKDINQLHNIYSSSLSNDILCNFGINTKKKYIQYFLDNNNGKIIVAYFKNRIIGFLFLRFKNLNMTRILDTRSIIKFLLISILNPSLPIRLIYQILYPIKNPKQSCEINYFAILRKYRSQNIGKKLINLAEKIALKKKYDKIYTKTYNMNLVNFYFNKKKAIVLKSFKIFNYKYHYLYWKIH